MARSKVFTRDSGSDSTSASRLIMATRERPSSRTGGRSSVSDRAKASLTEATLRAAG